MKEVDYSAISPLQALEILEIENRILRKQNKQLLEEGNRVLRKQNRQLRCCGNCAYLRYYPESIEKYDCAIRNLGKITSACEDWKMRRQR